MNNIFKRNKIYYFRSTLPQELKFYFDGKKEYIKSLRIKNINNAKIIARYLGKRLNLIKEEIKMLSHNEILKLIEEFKKISIVDIASRNSYLTQEEINEQLKELEKHNNIKLIEKEIQDAYNFLTKKVFNGKLIHTSLYHNGTIAFIGIEGKDRSVKIIDMIAFMYHLCTEDKEIAKKKIGRASCRERVSQRV